MVFEMKKQVDLFREKLEVWKYEASLPHFPLPEPQHTSGRQKHPRADCDLLPVSACKQTVSMMVL